MQKAKVAIVMGSDSDLPIMQEAAKILEKFGIGLPGLYFLRPPGAGKNRPDRPRSRGQRHRCDNRRSGRRGPSARRDRRPDRAAGDRGADQVAGPGRRGFPLFHRPDAGGDPRSHRLHRWGEKCRYSCRPDHRGQGPGSSPTSSEFQKGNWPPRWRRKMPGCSLSASTPIWPGNKTRFIRRSEIK